MYTRTATTSDSQKNITQSLQFNFLTEPNYDKETVFIKAKGTIGSGLRILDPNGYWNSTLRSGLDLIQFQFKMLMTTTIQM